MVNDFDEPAGTVRYTVKELLARLESKLDTALAVMENKADHDLVLNLAERVTKLETEAAERRGFGRAQTAVIGLLCTIAALLVPIALHFIP